ncbi:SAG-related sequence [Besnoitia besnoiti]|uniref:SAG-related sequence n=1 Tax=Besnoitia besnoiti TaxID=94643 RepID=A0A2A9ML53_BESBE|nr:SAG-related sequence [Besnoitia besnoiti]PFH36180.1 SAG-related sequence [Besnoitia besnoiti]
MARKVATPRGSRCFKSRTRKLIVACLGGILLFSSEQGAAADHPQIVKAKSGGNTKLPVVQKGVATCDLELAESPIGVDAQHAVVTLSESQLTVALQCKGNGNNVVPQTDGTVCTGTNDTPVKTCAAERNRNVTQVGLKDLLGASTDIKAAKRRLQTTPNVEEWSLILEKSQLPRTDESFFVGCKSPADENSDSKCKLDVTVKARVSSVEGNVVTCAYGAASNGEEPLTVDMTQENNKLTIDCGDEGSLKPAGFNNFCTSDDKDLETCSKQFVEMFPNFQKSWWQTTDAEGSPATLTIPPSDFPSEEKQFLLGCAPTKKVPQGAGGRAADGQPVSGAGNPSTCKVLVTVKAASSSASAMSALPMAAGVSGAAAVVTGLLARAF